MGYFSSGAEGWDYEERYCDRCLHQGQEGGCPIWTLHLVYNYRDANNPNSFLHRLIPLSPDGLSNQECRMFLQKGAP